ncbi:MAG: 2-oxoacid:acceptor oxidoreductase family protein, partial [Nanoarchaeota archaeon]
MKLNILIGGKAGQGINKVSEIVSKILVAEGYFTFNYRDYPSLIRGGHNFNVLCVSDKRVGSIESKFDIIVAMDENTIKIHKNQLKKSGVIITYKSFEKDELGRNINLALAGALAKIFGVSKKILITNIKKEFDNKDSLAAAEKGYASRESKFTLKKLNNKISIMTGSKGVSQGAINSNIDLYLAYPMTPATGVMNLLASDQTKNKLMMFQSENEIAVVNQALGASFAGAKTMIGTSGGGYDLMTEGLSLQGMSEIPLVVYLCSRPGPATGIPTYTSQADLDIALRGGHGEFSRVVIAPGDPIESIEKTNEAFYLSEKFGCLSIVLSDKHLAESEFSSDRKPNKTIPVKINRKIPGKDVIKASSYECDKFGNTTED